VEGSRLRERPDGFAVACGPGEVGMLLTRLRGVVSTTESPLRGLFEPNDAWLSTGDLFRADDDGDLWLVDRAQSLIRTAHGFVASFPIVDALGDLDAVDLAVVYGVPDEGADASLAIAAVTLLDGAEVDGDELGAALSVLPAGERPDLVTVVDDIPVTTWYRPSAAALRDAGVPSGAGVWRREGESYVAR
jgi:putative long chain acyl-CoA synthase